MTCHFLLALFQPGHSTYASLNHWSDFFINDTSLTDNHNSKFSPRYVFLDDLFR